MCDTMVVLPEASREGAVLFAKNSDREPDEVHEVVRIPSQKYLVNQATHCTYITIPAVAQTHTVLLSKPFWIWGAEMGINEYGVAIGNEALFTRIPHEKEPGLIGMDLLRLGLERGATASEALQTITSLLEDYGQGGNCGYHDKHFQYHNSFLIADAREAYVLETFGREWAAKKVGPHYAISNLITLTTEFDKASRNLGSYARKKHWWNGHSPLNLQEAYTGKLFTYFSGARQRRSCSLNRLAARQQEVLIRDLFAALREHQNGAAYAPFRGSNADVCMHAADPVIRKSQTVGSMVSAIFRKGPPLVFVTATSAPCLSVFKPVFVDLPLPWRYPERRRMDFRSEHLWWQHELLHRAFLFRYERYIDEFSAERNELESEFVRDALAYRLAPTVERARWIAECFERSQQFEQKWLQILGGERPHRDGLLYRFYWKRLNRRNKLPRLLD